MNLTLDEKLKLHIERLIRNIDRKRQIMVHQSNLQNYAAAFELKSKIDILEHEVEELNSLLK